MAGEQIVELQRRDLVAAPRNDLLRAPDQFDAAVRAPAGNIARPEEAVAEGGPGRIGIVQVAEHAEWRSDPKLARRAVPNRAAMLGREPEFHALRRRPDASVSGGLIGGRETEIARTGLGQAVEVVEAGRRECAADRSGEGGPERL